MKKHEEEVAKVQEKYDELSAMTHEDLFIVIMAPESAVAKARDKLIVGIIVAGK